MSIKEDEPDKKNAAPKTFWDECDYMILWNQDAPESKPAMNDKNITNAAGQFEMGRRYYSGDGVEQDYTQAALCYMEAAEQGHVDAQFYLGQCYRKGEGTEQDNEKAAY